MPLSVKEGKATVEVAHYVETYHKLPRASQHAVHLKVALGYLTEKQHTMAPGFEFRKQRFKKAQFCTCVNELYVSSYFGQIFGLNVVSN